MYALIPLYDEGMEIHEEQRDDYVEPSDVLFVLSRSGSLASIKKKHESESVASTLFHFNWSIQDVKVFETLQTLYTLIPLLTELR